jgi:hypothetical protein
VVAEVPPLGRLLHEPVSSHIPLFLKLNGADNLSALGRSYARGAQLLVLGFNEAFSLELLASPPPFFEEERALGVILIL